MKKFILGLILLGSLSSNAIPVINENHANSGVMTIYQDHLDPNRYYVAPNVVVISRNEKGVPYFAYDELPNGWFQPPTGVMQMLLVPAYTRTELELAKQKILEKNPAAQFSGIPFIASSLALTGDLPLVFADTRCNHRAGQIGQEQACVLTLTERGRKMFRQSLKRKTIFTTLQFDYSFQGAARLANGGFADQTLTHGIAVRVDGAQLSPYRNLIHLR